MIDAINRRRFLAAMAGMGAATVAGPALAGLRPADESTPRKLVVVLFGGGTRSKDTIDDPEHRHIPRLWNQLIPQGTLFTNMRVDHKVVHPNAAGSIKTGHWEWDDIDWSRPVAHPTIFEIVRKARGLPDTKAWAFVYASILARTGESHAAGYGRSYGANVVEPPTIPRSTSDQLDAIMMSAAQTGSPEAERAAAKQGAALVRHTSRISRKGWRSRRASKFMEAQFAGWKQAGGTTSHDAFLTSRAIACMKTFAPEVISVDYGEIDCAHYGSWSRYIDAIQRTDALTFNLWQAIQSLPAYRDNTLMLILPDHGRELEETGGWGFVHHSDFYSDRNVDEGCRRVWMLALGPGVAAGRRVQKAVPITAAAATGLEFMGLEASKKAAGSVLGSALG